MHYELSSAFAEEVTDSVHIETECEAHGLVERRALSGSEHIGGVKSHYIERETGAESEIASSTLHSVLVVVAHSYKELVVVGILSPQRNVYLLQLFGESTGSV